MSKKAENKDSANTDKKQNSIPPQQDDASDNIEKEVKKMEEEKENENKEETLNEMKELKEMKKEEENYHKGSWQILYGFIIAPKYEEKKRNFIKFV